MDMEAPAVFVDEQVTGPFRLKHEFKDYSAGTVMIARIAFEVSFGPLGRLGEKLVLAH